MLERLYDTWGVDAVYTPPGGGAAVAVRVRSERPRERVDIGTIGAMVEVRRLRVRVVEIGTGSPRGGTLVAAEETLRVKSASLDKNRQEYSLGLEPAP